MKKDAESCKTAKYKIASEIYSTVETEMKHYSDPVFCKLQYRNIMLRVRCFFVQQTFTQ